MKTKAKTDLAKKSVPLNLMLEANGWFPNNIIGDPSRKCDLAHISKYQWSVTMRATDERLSPEGFIIEVSRLQKYFDNTYSKAWPAMSCELMAVKTVTDLSAILLREQVSVVSISATLRGAHGGRLSALWVRPNYIVQYENQAKTEND